MAFVGNPFAFPGLVVGALGWAMALFVLFARPDRAQNRRLALVLFAEGLIVFAGNGAMFATTERATAVAWQSLATMALLAMVPLYLRFISTLATPVVAPLRWRPLDYALIVAALALPMTWWTARDFYLAGMYAPWFAPWEQIPGPGFLLAALAVAIAYLYGLLAALHNLLRAPRRSVSRQQAGWFLSAFGIRDGLFVAIVLSTTFVPALSPEGPIGAILYGNGPAAIALLYLPILAYGILRFQLFDIELRLKWTIRRGSLVAVFALVFVAVAEVAQNWLNDAFGYVAGGLAAALLVLFLGPLQRVADRVADRALPGVSREGPYLAYKRMEVYRAALEGALEEGGIDDRERAVLRRLRQKLGIPDEDAAALEREVAAS